MGEVVKLLLGDDLHTAERHLPTHLEEIKNIAEKVKYKKV